RQRRRRRLRAGNVGEDRRRDGPAVRRISRARPLSRASAEPNASKIRYGQRDAHALRRSGRAVVDRRPAGPRSAAAATTAATTTTATTTTATTTTAAAADGARPRDAAA